ncbi:MAG: sialidase family protein [Pirellulales bacterium]
MRWAVLLFACCVGAASSWADDAAAPTGAVRVADVVDGHIHPSVCLTHRGILVATYGRVNHRDLRIVRSSDGGRTWSASEAFPLTKGKTYYPGSLTALSNGDVVHAWNRWSADDNEREPRAVVYSVSRDDGATWGPMQALPHSQEVRSVIRHPLVELPDGRWLASLDDQTLLWNPQTRDSSPFGDGRRHGLVPIVRTPRGTWVSGAGVRSEDQGRTWTEIAEFPNLREQGWRHELMCLSNGWLLASEILGPGVGGERIRYRISRDDGRTWKAAYEYYNPGRAIGGRACPRTVELDRETIGVLFYDVASEQPGGPGLFFKRIALRDLPES